MPDRFLNIVFQGGGVRGVAYAGALESLPKDFRLHTVAGASAGSIAAALLAIGKTPAQIKEILSDHELFNLLEPLESKRAERIQKAFQDVGRVWNGKKEKVSWSGVLAFLREHGAVFKDLNDVWTERGLHRSVLLRTWLDKVTERKTFDQAAGCEELKILAADVSSRKYRIYSKAKDPARHIAEALHASVSIPVFFAPFVDGTSFLVDGGLLSNFPSFLIGQGSYPTVGFRLDDFDRPPGFSDTFGYLKALLMTMAEAHDDYRDYPPNFKSYTIYTAKVPSTKFALDDDDVKLLFKLGQAVGQGVEWDKYSSEKPDVLYYDPKPQKTLEFSLSQVHKLWRSFADEKNWLETFRHEATFSVYIEKDWSTRYDRVGEVRVEGKRSLLVTQFRLLGVPADLGGPLSLVDVDCIAEELHDDRAPTPLVRIPAFNGAETKGFLLFLTPPVSDGEAPRKMHTQFRLAQEFVNSLGKGTADDTVTYTAQQLARKHSLKLNFRILVDNDLPELELHTEFGGTFTEKELEIDPHTRRACRTYECQLGWLDITRVVTFRVKLSRK